MGGNRSQKYWSFGEVVVEISFRTKRALSPLEHVLFGVNLGRPLTTRTLIIYPAFDIVVLGKLSPRSCIVFFGSLNYLLVVET